MATGVSISRRTVLGLLAAEVAATSVKGIAQGAKPAKRPNVVFVLIDDVGYGDLACLGNPVIKTPNLDRLHAESTRLTDFHVSPTCAPTRASLMTGRYCNATGVWHTINGRSILNKNNVTLGECFKSSGYRTGIYGKWHLGDNYPYRPHDRGFDDAVVCGGGGLWQTPDYFGNDDFDDSYLHNGTFQKYKGFSTNVFFDLAMDFIRDAQKSHEPFFCMLTTTAAHTPTWAQDKDAAPYEGVTGLGTAGFYGMVANIDENVGRLRRFLEENHLAEDTILIFSSDNGTAEGEHVFNASMRGAKSSPYEGGHREPLFFYWPGGGIRSGVDVPMLTSHIDVLPTLVDLCKLNNKGKDVDGVSWRPLLYGKADGWRDRTIVVDSQREEYLVKWKDTSVMSQRWRLVNPSPDGNPAKLELYDIAKDPGQRTNVIAAFPEAVAMLKDAYETWWKKTSVGSDEYVRIVLGSDEENPSSLNAMDWHGDDSLKVWNQRQIRMGPIANGFWAVDVSRAGRYRFELRRWPREVDLPITAAYVDKTPNREKTPGRAISAVRASLLIGDVAETKLVTKDAKFVEFEVELPKGPAELRTAFYDAVLYERGAYYVYVERL